MQKIFTSTIFVVAFVVLSFNLLAQNCSPSPPNKSVCSNTIAETFTSGDGGFAGSGTAPYTLSSGKWTAKTTGNNSSFTSIITSAAYYKSGTMPNAVTAGFLASAGSKVTITTVKVDLLSSANTVLASCTQTVNLSGGSSTICTSITSPSLTEGTIFKYKFTVNTLTANGTGPAGSRDVTFDDFSYGGNSNAPLPVKFSSFEAKAGNNLVSLKWNVGSEDNVNGYEVESSMDGDKFSKIGFVGATGSSSYSFVDNKPAVINYYRIKSVDFDGKYGYSTVVMVKGGSSTILLKAFPSPFINKLSVQHGTASANSLITINSEDGRVVKSVIPVIGTQQTEIDLSTAKSGLYLVRYRNGNGQVEILKIMKQ
jgi:hypothetical protein